MKYEELVLHLKTLQVKKMCGMKDIIKDIGISATTYKSLKDNKRPPHIITLSKIINYLKNNGIEIDNIEYDGMKINC